ncbi:MAG: hypothetical protein HYR56_13545 [Acidobacteria bacterium]|nr:hypothetical protein [Acidobacteriota bacterium]
MKSPFSSRLSLSVLSTFVLFLFVCLMLQKPESTYVTSLSHQYILAKANQDNPEKAPERRIILQHSPKKIPELRMVRSEKIDGEDWLDKFEVEYKNFSDKPIYYICIYIILPETEPYGGASGFRLEFGDREFSNPSVYATQDDLCLKPGESHVFKIPKNQIKNHKEALAKWTGKEGFSPTITKVEIDLYHISFGDGTWYSAGHFFTRKTGNIPENKLQRSRGRPVPIKIAVGKPIQLYPEGNNLWRSEFHTSDALFPRPRNSLHPDLDGFTIQYCEQKSGS